ncbi:MAG TPA: VWA domain-containing protein [Pyrinomonadaceae bacterium]|nr:VWA domain-containing protein [Pyrinomonadaceae bacterium]
MCRNSRRRPSPVLVREMLIVAALVMANSLWSHRSFTAFSQNSNPSLRFELPANGNLRVENLRGAVIAEVWDQPNVSIAAVTDSGEVLRSPAVIQTSDSLLSVRVPRVAGNAARVNLELRIPTRTHAAIFTATGPVEVRGVSSALLVQTTSGEIRVDLPTSSNANITAESKTGNVSSSLPAAISNQAQRPQLRARLGAGANSIRLYSQAGNITLAPRVDEQTAARTSPAETRQEISPREPSAPPQRPELIGSEAQKPAAGTPARPSNTPEEVSEDDVIRVDTELVSVNVSVVDRGTSRGVNDLTKDDFRMYEDNAAQQILHFDSSSAPFNLVLLVDLSGSTTKVVDLIKAAALHFVDAARPFDRIGVITFAGGQVVVSPLTTDHAALRERINGIRKPEGSTKLYDSLAFAMDEVFREAKDSRRNAIVVISDGLDSVMPNVTGEGSKLTYQEVVRQAREFDGVIYSIWTDTQSYEPLSPGDIQQETFDLAHDRMKEIADVGGGAFYECFQLQDLAGSYDRVVADLGTLYTLSYRPTNKVRDSSWRTIRVIVNRPNAVARGKRGYFAN